MSCPHCQKPLANCVCQELTATELKERGHRCKTCGMEIPGAGYPQLCPDCQQFFHPNDPPPATTSTVSAGGLAYPADNPMITPDSKPKVIRKSATVERDPAGAKVIRKSDCPW